MIASDLTSKTALAQAESSATLNTFSSAPVQEEKSQPVLLPQSLGRLFDEAFDLYKTHFAVLALIVALIFIPTHIGLHAVENLWLTPLSNQIRADGGDDNIFPVMGTALLGMLTGSPGNGVPGLLSLLISFMVSGPVALAVSDIIQGRTVTVRSAYRKSGQIMWRLLWGWMLIALGFICVTAVCMIVLVMLLGFLMMMLQSIGLMQTGGGEEIAVFFMILVVICPYVCGCLMTAYFFAFMAPLVALEGLSVKNVLSRNSQLIGKKIFWRTSAAITFLPLVTLGLQFLTMWGFTSLMEMMKPPPWLNFLSSATIACILSCFFQPYWMIFLTMLYFDARMRREGLDIRMLADRVHRKEAAAQAAERDLTASSGGMMTGGGMKTSAYSPAPDYSMGGTAALGAPIGSALNAAPSVPPLPGIASNSPAPGGFSATSGSEAE